MNDNIDLTKILKNYPEGFKLYSSIHGEVKFINIHKNPVYSWINIITEDNIVFNYTSEGKYYPNKGECTLFPSKEQRDWNKFTAPWYKKEEEKEEKKEEKFNPKTLKPSDMVLVRNTKKEKWDIEIFSHIDEDSIFSYVTSVSEYIYCIPYNEDTIHLLYTKEEAPEFYKY